MGGVPARPATGARVGPGPEVDLAGAPGAPRAPARRAISCRRWQGRTPLTPVHSIVVLAVVTDPSAVESGPTLVAPATTSLVVHVVLANQGNVDEHGVEVGGEATVQGASASPVLVQQTVDLAAARSTTIALPGLKVVPGSTYTVQVVAESPHSPGTGALAARTIQVEVQPAATLTSVTSSPLVGRPGSAGDPCGRRHLVAVGAAVLVGRAVAQGTVTFADDGATMAGCGAQPVHKGQATCLVTYPAASAHAITAQYSGDARDAGSMSPAITLKVD